MTKDGVIDSTISSSGEHRDEERLRLQHFNIYNMCRQQAVQTHAMFFALEPTHAARPKQRCTAIAFP
jgi:hypothetical protein